MNVTDTLSANGYPKPLSRLIEAEQKQRLGFALSARVIQDTRYEQITVLVPALISLLSAK